MTHYFCKGTCKHVSMAPGECGDPNCIEHGKKFSVCECSDETHKDILVGYKIEEIKKAVGYLKGIKDIEKREGFGDLAEVAKNYENLAKLSEFCPDMSSGPDGLDSSVCHTNVIIDGKQGLFLDLFSDLRKLLKDN